MVLNVPSVTLRLVSCVILEKSNNHDIHSVVNIEDFSRSLHMNKDGPLH